MASLQSLAARLGEVTSLAVVYPAVASSRRMALLRAARVSVDQAVVVVPQIAELCSTMAGRGVGHWDAFAPTTDSAMSFPFSPVPRQGRLTGRPSVRKTDG